MENQQLKLIYTFDDALPFIFQTINSELGTQNTFSAISLDTGVLAIGQRGFTMTTPTSSGRIDLQIPDEVFNISINSNNSFRTTAARDFRNEWVYFTYCPGDTEATSLFPNRTLLYNYREQSWAQFNENYTHYGTYRRTTAVTWATIGQMFPTWADWNEPWNSYGYTPEVPIVIGGNQQGFVMQRIDSTGEGTSQYISAVNTSTGVFTSPNHCLNSGDYIIFSGVLGVLNPIGGTINGTPYKIEVVTANTFSISAIFGGVYGGGGVYQRLSRPQIQTKQFPLFWKDGRGVRVGPARFLLDKTAAGQITVGIYTNQNSDVASNDPTINPYLPWSNIVLTSPEPNNLYSSNQAQIWHRLSNSFTGDTVQFGFTLDDEQMMDPLSNQSEITLHAIVLDLYPGGALAV
jgi:hypothetical protein